jgi:hypothetical protein
MSIFLHSFKGIASRDFDSIFMLLSYSLDVRQVPLHIHFFILMFSYSNLIYDFFSLKGQSHEKVGKMRVEGDSPN